MNEQQYYLTVKQLFEIVEIEIRTSLRPPSDCISAMVGVNEQREVVTYVFPSVTLSGKFTPDEVYERMDWLRVAAEATELLASMIKTPDDLKRSIKARMSNGFIIIELCKGA
jgi:hypothetical protein